MLNMFESFRERQEQERKQREKEREQEQHEWNQRTESLLKEVRILTAEKKELYAMCILYELIRAINRALAKRSNTKFKFITGSSDGQYVIHINKDDSCNLENFGDSGLVTIIEEVERECKIEPMIFQSTEAIASNRVKYAHRIPFESKSDESLLELFRNAYESSGDIHFSYGEHFINTAKFLTHKSSIYEIIPNCFR